jgi:cellobiose-specific phosphotransferase system component IIA
MLKTKTSAVLAVAALLTAGLLAVAQGMQGEYPAEDVESALAEALRHYHDGDYDAARQVLAGAAAHLERSHTARDRELIYETIDDYLLYVLNGEFEEALALLNFSKAPDRTPEGLQKLYESAAEKGLEFTGLTLTDVRFTQPQWAVVSVLVYGVDGDFAEAQIRVEKRYVSQWLIEGYPSAGSESITCLLPLERHPDCRPPKPKPKAKPAPKKP